MHERIVFKLLFVTYKVINGLPPGYLTNFLVLHQPNGRLRSNTTDNLRLYRPILRTENYDGRSFSSRVPTVWNDHPFT